jgi:hypothetical protein
MFWDGADNVQAPLALHDLALAADFFDRTSDFHLSF